MLVLTHSGQNIVITTFKMSYSHISMVETVPDTSLLLHIIPDITPP